MQSNEEQNDRFSKDLLECMGLNEAYKEKGAITDWQSQVVIPLLMDLPSLAVTGGLGGICLLLAGIQAALIPVRLCLDDPEVDVRPTERTNNLCSLSFESCLAFMRSAGLPFWLTYRIGVTAYQNVIEGIQTSLSNRIPRMKFLSDSELKTIKNFLDSLDQVSSRQPVNSESNFTLKIEELKKLLRIYEKLLDVECIISKTKPSKGNLNFKLAVPQWWDNSKLGLMTALKNKECLASPDLFYINEKSLREFRKVEIQRDLHNGTGNAERVFCLVKLIKNIENTDKEEMDYLPCSRFAAIIVDTIRSILNTLSLNPVEEKTVVQATNTDQMSSVLFFSSKKEGELTRVIREKYKEIVPEKEINSASINLGPINVINSAQASEIDAPTDEKLYCVFRRV